QIGLLPATGPAETTAAPPPEFATAPETASVAVATGGVMPPLGIGCVLVSHLLLLLLNYIITYLHIDEHNVQSFVFPNRCTGMNPANAMNRYEIGSKCARGHRQPG